MTSYYEKPKGWSEAPKESWVSGTPIGQSEIKMPDLGDPGAHEDASDKVSFEDAGTPALYQGRSVSQCPPGTSNQKGVCMPDPKSEASLESKIETATKGGKQWGKEKEPGDDEKAGKGERSFKRELPEAPKEADAQIRRLAKEGVKGRAA
jgi:hypothetical protein